MVKFHVVDFMFSVSLSLSSTPLAAPLYWVVLETSRCCRCRGTAAWVKASSSTRRCTRWVSTTNTPGATETSTSKSTGTTSTHVGADADYDWLTQTDIIWFWLTLSFFFCNQILPSTSKSRTQIISTLRMTTPLLCTMEGKEGQNSLGKKKKKKVHV